MVYQMSRLSKCPYLGREMVLSRKYVLVDHFANMLRTITPLFKRSNHAIQRDNNTPPQTTNNNYLLHHVFIDRRIIR